MLRENLKIDAWLVGRTVKRVVDGKLIFSSIGKVRVKCHSSVWLIKVPAIIEIGHHSIGLGDGLLIEEHILVIPWHA